MSIVTELDLAIKKSEIHSTSGSYCINELSYDTYMTNFDWDIFKNQMYTEHPQAYAEFNAGGGGEIGRAHV